MKTISGLKLRMRDHFRSQKMALWLNLVPDLQSAAAASYGKTSGKKDAAPGHVSGKYAVEKCYNPTGKCVKC